MPNLTAKLLKATVLLNGSVFENATLFIIEHNEKGATGFIINKLFTRKFNDLVEFRHSPDFPLYYGGPVDEQGLFFLHKRPDIITESKNICDEIYFGGDFKKAVTAINNHTLTTATIKLLTGYCGWDTGQLEEEINEGSWELVEVRSNSDLFI